MGAYGWYVYVCACVCVCIFYKLGKLRIQGCMKVFKKVPECFKTLFYTVERWISTRAFRIFRNY